MFIDGFIWLPDIVDKLVAKHRVTQDEAEEIFFNRPRFLFVEKGYRSAKTYTRPPAKPIRAVISSSSSSTSLPIQL